MTRRSVVFPAPFGPRTCRHSPVRSSNETPPSTRLSPRQNSIPVAERPEKLKGCKWKIRRPCRSRGLYQSGPAWNPEGGGGKAHLAFRGIALECRQRLNLLHPCDSLGGLHVNLRPHGIWVVQRRDLHIGNTRQIDRVVVEETGAAIRAEMAAAVFR